MYSEIKENITIPITTITILLQSLHNITNEGHGAPSSNTSVWGIDDSTLKYSLWCSSSWLAKINDEINLVGIVTNSEHPLTVIIKNNRIHVRRVKCSQVYWSEINKIMEIPTCYYKWESEYFYATFDWELINVIPSECTTEIFLESTV